MDSFQKDYVLDEVHLCGKLHFDLGKHFKKIVTKPLIFDCRDNGQWNPPGM